MSNGSAERNSEISIRKRSFRWTYRKSEESVRSSDLLSEAEGEGNKNSLSTFVMLSCSICP